MRSGLALGSLRGVEIGPLADPLVVKSEGDVLYIDHTDAATLRQTYAGSPEVDVAAIVEVDAIWGERTLQECVGSAAFDYVMASHVAEHVPDLVTWLGEVRSVLRTGGELRLALPDARFSHDALRSETRLIDLLTAWVLRARRPQVRDVLDFRLHVASIDARTVYAGTADLARVERLHGFDTAMQAAVWARDIPEHYFDVHCWVMSPRTFARLMHDLAHHALLPLACAGMVDTAPPIWEFYAFLTPCDDPAVAARSWQAALAGLQDPLPGSGAALQRDREARRRMLEATLVRDLTEQNEQAAAEIAGLSDRLQTVQGQLKAVRGSLSWRLTAPLRGLRARFG